MKNVIAIGKPSGVLPLLFAVLSVNPPVVLASTKPSIAFDTSWPIYNSSTTWVILRSGYRPRKSKVGPRRQRWIWVKPVEAVGHWD